MGLYPPLTRPYPWLMKKFCQPAPTQKKIFLPTPPRPTATGPPCLPDVPRLALCLASASCQIHHHGGGGPHNHTPRRLPLLPTASSVPCTCSLPLPLLRWRQEGVRTNGGTRAGIMVEKRPRPTASNACVVPRGDRDGEAINCLRQAESVTRTRRTRR